MHESTGSDDHQNHQNDFAELIDALRHPTGPTRGSEWRGDEAVAVPESLDRKLRGFVENHRRRGERPSRWPFARKLPQLLMLQTTRAQETFVVERLARRLVRRIYSFDMRDEAFRDTGDPRLALAPLRGELPCIVHLHAVDAAPNSHVLAELLDTTARHVAVVATAHDRADVPAALLRRFAIQYSWGAEAGSPLGLGASMILPN